MSRTLLALLLTIPLHFAARASDEIPGHVADLISAIRKRELGKTFELVARTSVAATESGTFFAIEDETGAMAIRRKADWPKDGIGLGCEIKILCEIDETPAHPIGAYYLSHTVRPARSGCIGKSQSGSELSEGGYDGCHVRISGTISDVLHDETDPSWIWLVLSRGRSKDYVLHSQPRDKPIDADSLVGSEAIVSGFCVKTSVGACLHGGRFVLADGDHAIRISRQPSQLPLSALLALIGILLAVLVAIVIWNAALRRLVERRSRELADETVARVTSDLRVSERTRLAVELHDSITQNLTGASMEIRTADRLARTKGDESRRHLQLALKTLDACRKDLRNCLWDLRNLTLEEEDINDAIRRTLQPHIGTAELFVRFNVPRSQFCDNTLHMMLCVIRELTVNAIRHGKATVIRVAGSIEGDRMLCSVRDNGTGFDPQSVPGMAEGHFGLQGIRDRVAGLEGEVSIESAVGKGCRTTISIRIPSNGAENQ